MKTYIFIPILLSFFIKLHAQNNIIPNGTFESCSSPGVCIVGSTDINSNISNWYLAKHNIDKEEGFPDWMRNSWCDYNNYCNELTGLVVNSPSYIAIKADVFKCKQKTFSSGYTIKRTHEAVGVSLLGGAAFTAYAYYTMRYKLIPIKAVNIFDIPTNDDPDHATCKNLLTNCHLRVFLTKKSGGDWNDASGNVKQEVINANYVTSSGSDPVCNWIVVERTFVVDYSGMKNLILYAESGGFIIDDVEIFPKCDDNYLIQNKNYYFPLYAPNTQYGNHFSEQSMDYIHAGFNVGSSSTGTGNVLVGDGAAIVYTAQNKITLSPGFKAETGSYFHALIDYCPNNDRAMYNMDTISSIEDTEEMDVLFLTETKELSNTISIIPNPNIGTFKISISNSKETITILSAKVYDILGKIVWEKENVLSNELNIDISSQPQGIYYCRVDTGIGNVETKKIIKQ